MRTFRRQRQWLISIIALTLSACGTNGDVQDPKGSGANPGPKSRAALKVGLTCPELREALAADAQARVTEELTSLQTLAPPVPFAAPSPGAEEGGLDNGTQTNVQVAGVDEADTVEFDESWIHILQTGYGSPELISVTSEPPELLAVKMRMDLEGDPTGMFVHDGRAVVFSRLYETGPEFGDGPESGCAYSANDDANRPMLAQPTGIAYCGPAFTRISVIDLTPPQHTIVREFTLAGNYVSARRHGAIVRVVTTGGVIGPTGVSGFGATYDYSLGGMDSDTYQEAIDTWEEETRAAIEASRLEDWLPAAFERHPESDWQRLDNACGDVALPEEGTTGFGMTRIFGLNMMEDSGAVTDSRIPGGGQEIYANSSYVLLSQEQWGSRGEDDSNQTQLHLFAIGSEAAALGYIDSAKIEGSPQNQFSFDIRDEVIRVSATIWRRLDIANNNWQTEQINRIHTLRIGTDSLAQIGSTPDLAPDESIYATRFFEDMGYLVTFRQIDPLFAIDLSDPENPIVLGELELPGFSEYIHMLGEDHLLTVGRAGDADGNIGGVAVRVFDVSDPTQPTLRDEFITSEYGRTTASNNHRAFTFRESDGVLVLPFSGQAPGLPPGYSYLQLFHVDTKGIEATATISHPVIAEAPTGPGECRPDVVPCGFGPGSYAATMRRGLLRGETIYSISSALIKSHRLSDPTSPLASEDLARPD